MNTAFERKEQSQEWMTPPELVSSLGEFDLDPCACETSFRQYAPTIYTKKQNGLIQPWRGRVWCNPPYGRAAAGFISRLAEHGDGILLIFARVETRTWFEHIWPKADAVLFLRGRIRFYKPDGTRRNSAGAASALIAYGAKNVVALERLGPKAGYLVRLR